LEGIITKRMQVNKYGVRCFYCHNRNATLFSFHQNNFGNDAKPGLPLFPGLQRLPSPSGNALNSMLSLKLLCEKQRRKTLCAFVCTDIGKKSFRKFLAQISECINITCLGKNCVVALRKDLISIFCKVFFARSFNQTTWPWSPVQFLNNCVFAHSHYFRSSFAAFVKKSSLLCSSSDGIIMFVLNSLSFLSE